MNCVAEAMGLPGGLREWSGYTRPGAFNNVGTNTWWWSSTAFGDGGWHRNLNFSNSGINRNQQTNGSFGLSVRCLRNLTGKFSWKYSYQYWGELENVENGIVIFQIFSFLNSYWGVAARITSSQGTGKCASLNSAVAGKPLLFSEMEADIKCHIS